MKSQAWSDRASILSSVRLTHHKRELRVLFDGALIRWLLRYVPNFGRSSRSFDRLFMWPIYDYHRAHISRGPSFHKLGSFTRNRSGSSGAAAGARLWPNSVTFSSRTSFVRGNTSTAQTSFVWEGVTAPKSELMWAELSSFSTSLRQTAWVYVEPVRFRTWGSADGRLHARRDVQRVRTSRGTFRNGIGKSAWHRFSRCKGHP
ncbi:hypothetical protein LMG28727_06989 [Paraburkholderia kirstenboschensis]|nr:hypothetical protein LMG28727_06989 [Paraburkholderia kirstenboschensis]